MKSHKKGIRTEASNPTQSIPILASQLEGKAELVKLIKTNG